MKQSEVTQLTTDELLERIENEREALEKLQMSHTVSQLENPMVLRQKRRDIARLSTELRNRELNVNK